MDKTCTACGATKPVDQFDKKKSGYLGTSARCKPCQSAYRKAWYARNAEDQKARSRAYFAAHREVQNAKFGAYSRAKYASDPEYRAKQIASSRLCALAVRLEVFTHYSGGTPCCACCGEAHEEFLQLDHINGGGNKHRKQPGSKGPNGVLYWLRRNGYPDGYRVLCSNCNFSLGKRGYCPHEATRVGPG